VIPNESENPEWQQLRNLLNRIYAPQAIEKLRPKAKLWAAALVDQVIESGKCDIVDDIANPLPAILTMDMLGFSLHEWRDFTSMTHKLGYLSQEHQAEEFNDNIKKMNYYMRTRVDEEIALRRKEPKDDIFSYLATAEMGGKPLDRDMLHNISFQ